MLAAGALLAAALLVAGAFVAVDSLLVDALLGALVAVLVVPLLPAAVALLADLIVTFIGGFGAMDGAGGPRRSIFARETAGWLSGVLGLPIGNPMSRRTANEYATTPLYTSSLDADEPLVTGEASPEDPQEEGDLSQRRPSMRSLLNAAVHARRSRQSGGASLLSAGSVVDVGDYTAPIVLTPGAGFADEPNPFFCSSSSGAQAPPAVPLPRSQGFQRPRQPSSATASEPGSSDRQPVTVSASSFVAAAQPPPPTADLLGLADGPADGASPPTTAAPATDRSPATDRGPAIDRRYSGARAPRTLGSRTSRSDVSCADSCRSATPEEEAVMHRSLASTDDYSSSSPVLQSLYEMGFEEGLVRTAISDCHGDVVAALERLLSLNERLDSRSGGNTQAGTSPPRPQRDRSAQREEMARLARWAHPESEPRPQATQVPATLVPESEASAAPGSLPVATPVAMAAPGPIAEAVSVPAGAPSELPTPPTLVALVDYFERELGLNGPMLQVVDDACSMLQVPVKGSASLKALRCWESLGSPPDLSRAAPIARPPPVYAQPVEAHPVQFQPVEAQPVAALPFEAHSARQPSERTIAEPWTCSVCTFEHTSPNNMAFLNCEICGSARTEPLDETLL